MIYTVDTCEVCGELWPTDFLYQLDEQDVLDRCYYCLKKAESQKENEKNPMPHIDV